MKFRHAAIAAGVVVSTFALSSCAWPDLISGDPDKPASQPTAVASQPVTQPATVTPSPSTAAPSVSPSETASVPPVASGLTPMKRPTKTYPDPKFPKGPAESRPAVERLLYAFEKDVWKAAGTADKKTTGSCDITNAKLAKAGTHTFACTVTYDGVKVPVKVSYKTGSFISNYHYTMDSLPLSRQKAEYAAMYSAYNGVAVACDLDADTVPVQVGDEQGVLCHVQNKDGDVDDYYLEMSRYGSVYGNRA